MHVLSGGYVTVCSRMKHESSSSDDEHAASKPPSAGHLPLLSSVSYKKTLRLTSEQLVSVSFPRVRAPRPRRGLPDSAADVGVWVPLRLLLPSVGGGKPDKANLSSGFSD